MASADFYKAGAETIRKVVARTEAVEKELLTVMERWDALDSIGKLA